MVCGYWPCTRVAWSFPRKNEKSNRELPNLPHVKTKTGLFAYAVATQRTSAAPYLSLKPPAGAGGGGALAPVALRCPPAAVMRSRLLACPLMHTDR